MNCKSIQVQVFACLFLISVSCASEFEIELSEFDNEVHIDSYSVNGDRIVIQNYPFNYSVGGIPNRVNNILLKNQTMTRIVGGKEAKPHEFPHMLGMYAYDYVHKVYQFGCGASILNNQFAVSAAHCVEGENPHLLRLVAGEHDRSKNEKTEVVRNISHIMIHENYTGSPDYHNDIALLRFDIPLVYNNNIQPIAMATRNKKTTGNVTVAGWGHTMENGTTSMILRKATLPIVSLEDCQDIYGDRIDDTQLCAGYKKGKIDSCQGDSGGPLMQKDTRGKKHILVGVVSVGNGCARPDSPGIYTSIAKFRDWINPRIII